MKRRVWAFWWLLVAAACGDDGELPAPDAPQLPAVDAGVGSDATPSGDILADLQATPGVVAVSETGGAPSGYRAFALRFEQPADHFATSVPFQQRVLLLHRSYDAPTVLVTEGYTLTPNDREGLTVALDANQIIVEHRFFGSSRPAPEDWSQLDIRQAAADHHRVTDALKWIYTRRWINFGVSKGGMTAVYHRRFYPDDVDGTVAYVAPLSLSRNDPRYEIFVDGAGPDPACRQMLRDFQRLALSRRADMLSRMSGTYDHLGKDLALEHGVLELPFFFWQYHRATECSSIPTAAATSAAVFAFLDGVSALRSNYGDADLVTYAAYYVQAEHELGYPAANEAPVADLLLHPGTFGAAPYLPEGVSVAYLPESMAAVDAWVKDSGERLLFVYGEYDPWTAGAFDLGATPRDSFKFIVPAGNPGADIYDLGGADRAAALDALSRWADAPIGAGTGTPGEARERPRTRL